MHGKLRPPLYFIYLAIIQYIALSMVYYWYGYQGNWIDRFLVFEIWFVCTVTWLSMLIKTGHDMWTRRGVGIFGFMLGVSVLTTMSQAVEWGYLHAPIPQWAVNLYRSPMSLATLFILYGYYRYWQGDGWDDERKSRDAILGGPNG